MSDPRRAALPPALVERNVGAPDAMPNEALLASFAAAGAHALPARIAYWAERFLEWGEADYRLGDAPGGYVAQGLLVNDRHTDCVLFSHRAVELAHAEAPEDALHEAIARRFPGASPADLVAADGRVDYGHPSRIVFAWELVEAGVLGRNVTAHVGAEEADSGTSHFEPGRVRYVPSRALRVGELRAGDVVWFVLDEAHDGARRVRESVGATIGHLGVITASGDASSDGPRLVHAASADLPGTYEGGRVVGVPLLTYLARVERFKGVVVTRHEDTATAASG